MTETQTPQSQGVVGEIVHAVETAVEHVLHPGAADAAPSSTEPVQEAGNAALGEPLATGAMAAAVVSVDSSLPGAAATPSNAPVADTSTPPAASDANAAAPASSTAAAVVAADAPLIPSPTVMATEIRMRIGNIKAALLGFEASTVAKIHAELEAIERVI